jgi:hypothetical protein
MAAVLPVGSTPMRSLVVPQQDEAIIRDGHAVDPRRSAAQNLALVAKGDVFESAKAAFSEPDYLLVSVCCEGRLGPEVQICESAHSWGTNRLVPTEQDPVFPRR